MTYEEYFKNGDKFVYESIGFCETVVYIVEITNVGSRSASMQVIFNRLGDATKTSSCFSKIDHSKPRMYKIKEVY